MEICCGVSIGASAFVVASGNAPAAPRELKADQTTAETPMPLVVVNDDGDRVTPAAVLLPEECGPVIDALFVTGAVAKSSWVRLPKRVVDVITPLIGDNAARASQQYKIGFEYELKERAGAEAAAAAEGEEPETPPSSPVADSIVWHPDDGDNAHPIPMATLFTALLGRIKEQCESAAGGNRIAAVCVAVPRSADHSAITAVANSVFTAPNCQSLRVVCDDTAALLASLACANNVAAVRPLRAALPTTTDAAPSLAMVVDVGAKSAYVSIFEVRGGTVSFLSTSTKVAAMGTAIDRKLAEDLAAIFKRKRKFNVLEEARPMRKLVVAAEKCKCTLSTSTAANCEVEALHEGCDLMESVSRARLDGLIDELGLGNTFAGMIAEAFKEAQSQLSDPLVLQRVVLSGGTCRVPKVQALIAAAVRRSVPAEFMASDCVFDSTLPSDEVTAVGAAVAAQIIASHPIPAVDGAGSPGGKKKPSGASPARVRLPPPPRDPRMPALAHDVVIGLPPVSGSPTGSPVTKDSAASLPKGTKRVLRAGTVLPTAVEVALVGVPGAPAAKRALFIGEAHRGPDGNDTAPRWAYRVDVDPQATPRIGLRVVARDDDTPELSVVDIATGKALSILALS